MDGDADGIDAPGHSPNGLWPGSVRAVSTRRRSVTVLLAVLGLGALALAACADGSGAGSRDTANAPLELEGTSWVLVGRAGDSGTVDAVAEPAATLRFAADGALSGSTGCNRFAGTYTQQGAAVRIDLGPMTLAGCTSEELDAQERAVLAALPNVRTALASAGRLDLVDEDGAVLLTYAPGTTDLVGTSWVATGINNGAGAVVGTADTGKVTLAFGSDGTVSGSGGCNSFTGPYTLGGPDELTVGPVASTMKACQPESVMETEAQYFAALAKVVLYEVDGSTLTLRGEDGAAQVVLRSA